MLLLLRTIAFAIALAPCIGHGQYYRPGYPMSPYSRDDDRYIEEMERRHEYRKQQFEDWHEYRKQQVENWREYRKQQMEAWREHQKRQFERWRDHHEENEQ